MKYSGVEWIGQIPKEWNICKVKNVFYHHKNIAKEQSSNYDRVSLTMNGVLLRDKEDANGLQPESFEKYQIVNKQDIIFKLIDLENVNTSRVGRSPYEGITSPAYILLHEKKYVSKYYDYYFTNLYYQEIYNNIGGNGVRSAINKEGLLNIPLIIPPVDEQEKIIYYLDKKVKEIDKLIQSNMKVIDLIEEYKENYISKYITGNYKENLIKSDLQFLNKIPLDWKCCKIKNIVSLPVIDGPHESPELVEDGIPYISADAIEGGQINFNNKRGYITKEYSKQCNKRYKPQKNDILVVKLGASIGKMAIVGENTNFNIWVPLAVVRCKNNINSKFVFYAMNSRYFKNEIKFGMTFGTQETLGVKTLQKLKILIPNIEEQNKIVNKIELKINLLNKFTLCTKQMIQKLEEYKKALIYEVVTGKKEIE